MSNMEQRYNKVRNTKTGEVFKIPARPRLRHNDWKEGNKYATEAIKRKTT